MTYQMQTQFRAALVAVFAFVLQVLAPQPAQAADRESIQSFLEVTGFDVALDSIALSAESAPEMLGMDAGAFGTQWSVLADQVFDTGRMREQALGILEQTLDQSALDFAVAFYGSDLGQRLVVAENAAHRVEDGETKQVAGERLLEQYREDNPDRIALFERMNEAVSSDEAGVRSVQQLQYRFMMAASAAGVIELRLDADGLRAWQAESAPELRKLLRASALAASAYSYQGFSNDEILQYVEALEDPLMQSVYELLNAVQHEITANRYEELAYRMQELGSGQDL